MGSSLPGRRWDVTLARGNTPMSVQCRSRILVVVAVVVVVVAVAVVVAAAVAS